MRSRFRPISLILAIVAAFTLVAPVAAANPWVITKQAGSNAIAFADSCSDNPDGTVTCTSQSLEAFRGQESHTGQPTFDGDRVCYSDHTVTFDPATGQPIDSSSRFGCVVDPGTLTIRKLNSVTLRPTVIPLTEMSCEGDECTEETAGTISVRGRWTGEGPTGSQRGNFRFDDGTCVQVHSDASKFRTAAFVGTFEALDSRISKGSSTFKTNCAI